jgi:hypothetical protein
MTTVTRIAKNDPLAAVAKTLTERNLEAATGAAPVPRSQQALVDLFLKFAGPREGEEVTAKDVSRAVAQARALLVAKYGLDSDGASKAELEQASLAGRRAVELAKALRAAPPTAAE